MFNGLAEALELAKTARAVRAMRRAGDDASLELRLLGELDDELIRQWRALEELIQSSPEVVEEAEALQEIIETALRATARRREEIENETAPGRGDGFKEIERDERPDDT